MGGRVGQLVAFVVTGQLFGVEEGIAKAQFPLAVEVPAVCQLDTLVAGFSQVLETTGRTVKLNLILVIDAEQGC